MLQSVTGFLLFNAPKIQASNGQLLTKVTFMCRHCKVVYNTPVHLASHLKKVIPRIVYHCLKCKNMYTETHSCPESSIKCAYCLVNLEEKSIRAHFCFHLISEEISFINEEEVSCKICQRNFHKDQLVSHMRKCYNLCSSNQTIDIVKSDSDEDEAQRPIVIVPPQYLSRTPNIELPKKQIKSNISNSIKDKVIKIISKTIPTPKVSVTSSIENDHSKTCKSQEYMIKNLKTTQTDIRLTKKQLKTNINKGVIDKVIKIKPKTIPTPKVSVTSSIENHHSKTCQSQEREIKNLKTSQTDIGLTKKQIKTNINKCVIDKVIKIKPKTIPTPKVSVTSSIENDHSKTCESQEREIKNLKTTQTHEDSVGTETNTNTMTANENFLQKVKRIETANQNLKVALTQGVIRKISRNKFRCIYCKLFFNRETVIYHLDKCSLVTCRYCYVTFANAEILEEHISNVQISVIHFCMKCDLPCTMDHKSKGVDHHIKSFCTMCHESLIANFFAHKCFHIYSYEELLNHNTKINEESMFTTCIHCNKKVPQDFLKIHVTKKHKEWLKTFTCACCLASFDKRIELKRHARKQHRGFLCHICGRTMHQSIGDHLNSHANREQHKCKQCSKRFALYMHLKRHMLVHIKKGRFVCSTCKKCFKTGYNLRVHKRIHEAVKPYQCSVCLKTFQTKQARNNHMKTH